MQLLNGKQISLEISDNLQGEIEEYTQKGKRPPRLDILLVGDDYASKIYVSMKSEKATSIGVVTNVHTFSESVKEDELITLIEKLNRDISVDGIMVQLPLPKHINQDSVLERVLPSKDVDGLTSTNLGKLFKNNPSAIPPATAKGVIELLKRYDIEIEGKQAVVVGRGDISGLPIAGMLQNENATVTLCHSYSKDLKNICKRADILVVSIGKAQYINREYIKEGCIVIDVGTNRDVDGKLVGDVDFNSVKDMAGSVTPVPGGIGPMTIACLLSNLLNIYKQNV
ncbi:bifunctional 5,10-methylenetetrahydrofolate dehydrogenase/5,10-methenyltetrahydrofolate cyclohydrolase [Candidatus Dojkabacteria bacterium]|uniref:Bifunctional protein FolD n=1 Tax=Candidatus Dojkabacteria bacterium TaxID=2099670 RepID=A0A847VED2_9BACT|nr:bifunctional 5,10-methylenetetrahydrofolate dehydrogenase/5,10-methenyltetrahydrofolate cyclohydrolase [Candidatus Dojkabacteria bacterium]